MFRLLSVSVVRYSSKASGDKYGTVSRRLCAFQREREDRWAVETLAVPV